MHRIPKYSDKECFGVWCVVAFLKKPIITDDNRGLEITHPKLTNTEGTFGVRKGEKRCKRH